MMRRIELFHKIDSLLPEQVRSKMYPLFIGSGAVSNKKYLRITCVRCRILITGKQVNEINDTLYCLPCYGKAMEQRKKKYGY